jgi:gamma-glutamyltranspeptidase
MFWRTLAACALSLLLAPDVVAGGPLATGRSFMVAAAHPRAVAAGCRILARGGTAADAAGALALGHVSGQRLSTRGGVTLRAELESGTPVARHRKALDSLRYARVTVGRLRSGLALVRVRGDGTLEGAADPRRDGTAAGH